MSFRAFTCIVLAAVPFMPGAWAAATDSCAISDNTGTAVDTLVNMYYNNDTGLWDQDLGSGSEWWTSANTVNVLASYVEQMPNTKNKYNWVFENTYTKAQQQTLEDSGNQGGLNYLNSKQPSPYVENGFVRNFTYYDDDGWWALAWVKVFDVTHDGRFLQSAANLFEVIADTWDDTCGGGVYWNQDKSGKNAIPNVLFLDLAAKLASRTGNRQKYSDWAKKTYKWIKGSGMINDQNLIVDGLDKSTCKSNNGAIWTYNQGELIGGLAELYTVENNDEYLDLAKKVADSAMEHLTTDGILKERCDPDCWSQGDAPIFKGIFMRNLKRLAEVTGDSKYKDFLKKNADKIWNSDRTTDNRFGETWWQPSSQVNALTDSSAVDALVAALAVSGCSQQSNNFFTKLFESLSH